MADETKGKTAGDPQTDRQRGIDEVSLEMMKFIALTTGCGKPGSSAAGFGSKASSKSGADEYADALLALFERCREVVNKGKA